jgi:hypothetical protein
MLIINQIIKILCVLVLVPDSVWMFTYSHIVDVVTLFEPSAVSCENGYTVT